MTCKLCGKTAHYVVSKTGYCRRHRADAVARLRTHGEPKGSRTPDNGVPADGFRGDRWARRKRAFPPDLMFEDNW